MTIDANWSIDIDNRWTIDAQVFSDCLFHRLSIFIDHRCQSISFKVRFCRWFLKPCNCIQTIRWTNSNLEHLCVLRVRIRTCWNVWDTNIFLTPIEDNRRVATTFVWLSIGHRLADANRYQLTNKALIVIDWSTDFPIIGFIDCTGPVQMESLLTDVNRKQFINQNCHSEDHFEDTIKLFL